MSEKELKELSEKTFARLVPSQITFIQCTTTVSNKKSRRGSYRFKFLLKEIPGNDDQGIIKHPVQVDMLAQQPAYFFTQMFSNDDEQLLVTGKPILAYLQGCPRKKGSPNTAIVTDSKVLNAGRLRNIKQAVCNIFRDIKNIKRKTNGNLYYTDEATGKYDITIYDPVSE